MVDPLYRAVMANQQWRGIFIEPVAEYFTKLVANYQNDGRFIFECVAISRLRGELPFFYLSESAIREHGLHITSQGAASFKRAHVLTHLGARDPSIISTTMVQCEPLMPLLAKHGIKHVDVLVIDAETNDYNILRQVEFAVIRPKLILYEHACLSADESHAAGALLRQHGYQLLTHEDDTLAVRRGG